MTSDDFPDFRTWRGRAIAAEARADAEARRSQRAQVLAEEGHQRLRELHGRLAELHRLNAERHRATAALYRSLMRQLAHRHAPEGIGRVLVNTLQEVSGSPSAAILLLADDGSTLDRTSTDQLAESAQDLEFVYAEGPLHTACSSGEPVVMTAQRLLEAWPQYRAATQDLGLTTVMAAPLQSGSTAFGAAGLFNAPSSAVRCGALVQLARVIARVFDDCAHDLDQTERLLTVDGMRAIHQAAGVVSVEAGCSIADALALIRAKSFVSDQPADMIALQVLEGNLHLDL